MQCTSPMRIKNPDRFKYKKPNESVGSEWLEVPCGHCIACRIARTREWTIRLLHESEFWEDTSFLTLTYNDDYLPSDGSLVPRDLTLFFKRLRKDLEKDKRKIKYYACGEYGDTYGRPHYHAIVFGISPKDKKLVEENWPYGFVRIGTVTYDSCRYVAGYVQKKLYGKGAEIYEEKGILPPFARMSKGLGERYVEKYWNKLWSQETVTVRGVPLGLPRYYKKKLDYDGFLTYDVDKEVNFKKSVFTDNQDYMEFLGFEMEKGNLSLHELDLEFASLCSHARLKDNAIRDLNLEARFKMKSRGSL